VVGVTRRPFDPNWDRRSVLRDLRRLWPARRPFPLLLAWYWRYEAILTVAVGGIVWALSDLIGGLSTLFVLMVTTTLIGLVPSTRDIVVRIFWHIVTPHRVRRGLVEAGIYSRKGRVPEVLRVRSVPSGELVSLWCFAGTSFAEISQGLGVIGTACYAREMQALADPQYLHLVSLLVVRYPDAPLPPGDWPSQRAQRAGPGEEAFRPHRSAPEESPGAAGDPARTLGDGSTSDLPSWRRRQDQPIVGRE
jgi:hypothetical protein